MPVHFCGCVTLARHTGLGVIIYDPGRAQSFAKSAVETLPIGAYEIFFDDRNKVCWRDNEAEPPFVYQKEPETRWSDRRKVGLVKILPIRSQLQGCLMPSNVSSRSCDWCSTSCTLFQRVERPP